MTSIGLVERSIKRTEAIVGSLAARAQDGVNGIDAEHNLLPSEPTTIVKTEIVEKLPDEYIERLQFIARGMDALRSRLELLEDQGTITPSDANDLVRSFGSRLDVTIEEKLANAIGDIRSRLSVVEQRGSPQVAKQLTKLAEAVHAVSDLVSSVEETVEQKSSQLERKYAEIASHINGVEDRVGKLALFGDLLATEVRKIGMA